MLQRAEPFCFLTSWNVFFLTVWSACSGTPSCCAFLSRVHILRQSDWPFWQPFKYSSSWDRCPSKPSMYRLLVLLPLLHRNVPTARPWRAWPTASLNTLLICSSEGIHQSGFEAQCILMNSSNRRKSELPTLNLGQRLHFLHTRNYNIPFKTIKVSYTLTLMLLSGRWGQRSIALLHFLFAILQNLRTSTCYWQSLRKKF